MSVIRGIIHGRRRVIVHGVQRFAAGGDPAPLVMIMGQSNAGDNVDWAQGDPGLTLNAVYPAVNFTQKYGISDPISWQVDNVRRSLQPSSASNPNMGISLTAGRMLYQRAGITELGAFAISGSKISRWLPGSGWPTSPGAADDLFDQSVDYIRAIEAASGTELACIIWIQGEQDSADSADSLAYQANLTTLMAAYRAEFGVDLKVVISKLNVTSSATYVGNVRSAQVAYAAGDANSVLVSPDDLPMIDAYHYGPLEISTLGNRLASAACDILGYGAQEVTTAAPQFIGAEPGVFGAGALVPRSRPDAVDGDFELMLTTANYLAGADSLSSAAGFTKLQDSTSVWDVVNSDNALWYRPVTQVVLDANGGRMPSPTVADSDDKNAAKIYLYRGPTGACSVDVSAVVSNNAADTAVSCPTLTTTVDDTLVVNFIAGWAGSGARTLSGVANASLSGFGTTQASIFGIVGEGVVLTMLSGTKSDFGPVLASTGTYDVYVVQSTFSVALKPA